MVFIFGGTALAAQENDGGTFSLSAIVVPLGMCTICFVTTTFLSGLLRRKLGRRFLKIHLLLAVISVVLGLLHGLLVFVLFD